MKYVRNLYTSDIKINLQNENGQKFKSIVFARYAVDRLTGNVASDGFTEVSDEDYTYLEKSNAFKLMLKNGNLVVQDEAPLKAGSFEQMLEMKEKLNALKAENDALKAENAALKAENEGLKKTGTDSADATTSQSEAKPKSSKGKAAGNKA